MSLASRARGPLAVVLLLAIAAGGASLGIKLAERATAPGTVELVFIDPRQLTGAPDFALRSAGGFTGFGGTPALGGDVLRIGVVSESEQGRLVIEGPGSLATVTYSSPDRLFAIGLAVEPLLVGDLVLVRLVDDRVAGILRVVPRPEPEPVDEVASEGVADVAPATAGRAAAGE